MELLSVSPLRVAGVIEPSGDGYRLRVIARATFVSNGGLLLLARVQHLPDDDDLLLLQSGGHALAGAGRKGERRVGRVIAGGAFYAFAGAAEELERQPAPRLRPKLFVENGGEPEEVTCDVAALALDEAYREVTVVWRAELRVPGKRRWTVASSSASRKATIASRGRSSRGRRTASRRARCASACGST